MRRLRSLGTQHPTERYAHFLTRYHFFRDMSLRERLAGLRRCRSCLERPLCNEAPARVTTSTEQLIRSTGNNLHQGHYVNRADSKGDHGSCRSLHVYGPGSFMCIICTMVRPHEIGQFVNFLATFGQRAVAPLYKSDTACLERNKREANAYGR